jgi:uncharacterized membrane protein
MLISMSKHLAGYLAVGCVIVGLDMLWLGLIAKAMVQQAIGHLMAERPRLLAAWAFYLLYPAGLMIFAVMPYADDPGWVKAVSTGALFGFFAYATYDLSNLATLRNWPVGLTFVDMVWGTLLSATAAAARRAAWIWAAKA